MQVEAKTEFNEKTVADLMRAPLSRRNVFVSAPLPVASVRCTAKPAPLSAVVCQHPVSRGYSAWSVLEALAREPGLHRVPVVDRVTREMYNFVTGSQVSLCSFCGGGVAGLPCVLTRSCPLRAVHQLAARSH
jgi:hypothetical protein